MVIESFNITHRAFGIVYGLWDLIEQPIVILTDYMVSLFSCNKTKILNLFLIFECVETLVWTSSAKQLHNTFLYILNCHSDE